MAHNIAFENGIAKMMYVGAKPWHKIGQYVGDNCVSWDTAIQAAGLNWTVRKDALFARNQDGSFIEVPSYGIFRDDNNKFVGSVGDRYVPIQNRDCFDFVDTLLGVETGAHYETAGALGNGYKIWTLARIPRGDFEIGNGDTHQMYLLFSTSHDGSLACSAKITDVRVVCNNTLNQAIASEGQLLRIKHTANAADKLDRAKQLMGNAIRNSNDLAEKMKTLAERKIDRETMTAIMDRLFPKPKDESSQTRRNNTVIDVLQRYDSNDRNAFPEQRGTAYNMLNAITNFADYGRTSRVTNKNSGSTPEQARFESALLGSGAMLKNQALEVILEETSNSQRIAMPIYSRPITESKNPAFDDIIAETMNTYQ